MIIAGIDPGITGALAVLDRNGAVLGFTLMPVIKVGTRSRVNGAAAGRFLRDWDVTRVVIERVGPMKGQGVTSSFTFGHAAGVVEGVCTGMGLPIDLVTPQAWKKHAGLIGQDKDAARSRAIQIYPDLRALDPKGKGQALADALLIARYSLNL